MAKYIFQAVAALSAGAFAFARTNDEEQKNEASSSGSHVALSSSSPADVTTTSTSISTLPYDEKQSSDLFKKSCMMCHTPDTNASISRNLRVGSGGGTCVFDTSTIGSATPNAKDCCSDSETGNPWTMEDLTSFLSNDPLHNVKQQDATAMALMLKDICNEK